MPKPAKELGHTIVRVNLGPSHPAMHGALRVQVDLDGEIIVNAVSETGYLHRGFEKHCEESTYTQCIPYTDRLNYVSSMSNNVGFCRAVEKLLGIEIPERAIYIRVVACELSRIIDHLVCVGTNIVDLGALTNFWYTFNVREKIYRLIEKMCGARLTTCYTRVGGLPRDLYDGFADDLEGVLRDLDGALKDLTGLVQKNRIFIDRTKNICPVSAEDAISYGFTGPCLRASGINYDVRKAHPYYHYDEFQFEVPLGEKGDSFDRIFVRIEEMRESVKIIRQAMGRMPSGPVAYPDPRVSLPPKEKVYTSIEGLMNHFMLIMNGIRPPAGEIYSYTEAPNGELGFFIISDGTGRPMRVRCRPPCFPMFAAYSEIIRGTMIADAVACIGGLNVVAGELER